MARFKPTDATFTPISDEASFTPVSDDATFDLVTSEDENAEVESMLERAGADAIEDAFLGGQVHYVTSSNVAWIQYLWMYPNGTESNELYVGFRDGSVYAYEDVTFEEALSMFRAGSKGGWVWDNLRVRGTQFGFQKNYRLVSGNRVWHKAGEESQARHQAIPKSGEPYKGYHPTFDYARAKGAMGATGINLGKKGSKKIAYFTQQRARTHGTFNPPKSK